MLVISLANPCFSSMGALNAHPQQLDTHEPIFGFIKKAAKKVGGLVL